MSILKSINSAFSGGPYYVRISKDRLKVRDASSDGYFDDEPLLGLTDGENPTIISVGAEARNSGHRYVNPFDHPRVVLSDFIVAEKLVTYAFKVVSGRSLLRAAPIAVVHVTDNLEGGLTLIERRALHELVEGAGARESHIWEGRELSDEELRSGAYQSAP